MAFWIVPESERQSTPCFSATTRYIAKIIGAGELIVIDVVIAPRSLPSKSVSMSDRDAQRGSAGGQQCLVAMVGLFRCAEPGELANGPRLAVVAVAVEAARVGELAGHARIRGVEARAAVR